MTELLTAMFMAGCAVGLWQVLRNARTGKDSRQHLGFAIRALAVVLVLLVFSLVMASVTA
jgi:hypothetical protein